MMNKKSVSYVPKLFGRKKRQKGEMPIGPILIVALIVLPLVFLLITYGGQIATSFTDATDDVAGAKAAEADAAKVKPPR
jgi:Na+-driven multidrug efflux pump